MERSSDDYQVTFMKHEESAEGHIEYLVKINAPGNYSFHFRDRYSSMRAFQSMIKKSFPVNVFNQLPQFPPKKAFGAKAEAFISGRSAQLQQFFNSFLKNKEIMARQEHNVLQYFVNHASDDQSRKSIQQFI
jgi:hypothetical protein